MVQVPLLAHPLDFLGSCLSGEAAKLVDVFKFSDGENSLLDQKLAELFNILLPLVMIAEKQDPRETTKDQ
jgi:hypothetical protein